MKVELGGWTYVVDIVTKSMLLDHGFEIEICVVRQQKQNPARDHFILRVVDLDELVSSCHEVGRFFKRTFSLSASLPASPVSTKIWRIFESRRSALATQRNAARRTSAVSPSTP